MIDIPNPASSRGLAVAAPLFYPVRIKDRTRTTWAIFRNLLGIPNLRVLNVYTCENTGVLLGSLGG
jgi:hypothetical protein